MAISGHLVCVSELTRITEADRAVLPNVMGAPVDSAPNGQRLERLGLVRRVASYNPAHYIGQKPGQPVYVYALTDRGAAAYSEYVGPSVEYLEEGR